MNNTHRPVSLTTCLLLLLALAFAFAPRQAIAQDAEFMGIIKSQLFVQETVNAPSQEKVTFEAFVELSGPGVLNGASVTIPGGNPETLVDDENEYIFSAEQIICMKRPPATINNPAISPQVFALRSACLLCQTTYSETNGMRKPWP